MGDLKIEISSTQMENMLAGMPIERLHNTVSNLVMKSQNSSIITRNKRRRNKVWESGHSDFFRPIPYPHWVINHNGIFEQEFQHVSGRNIGHIKGRILAKKDEVHSMEI